MIAARQLARWIVMGLSWLVIVPGLLAAQATASPPVVLAVATSEVSESLLLDVGIEIFDPGLAGLSDKKMEEDGIFEEVRKSEARFVPYHLKSVLESTGFWGAVRVVPRGTKSIDLRVSGRIVESNGFRLEVEITAVDARQKVWLQKSYGVRADPRAYDTDEVAAEPFSELYFEIANDLHKKVSKLDAREVAAVRAISQMQFAAGMAPGVFGDYLEKNGRGRVALASLPAEGDPMFERVSDLRERDHMFVDTLNEYYGTFYDEMALPYREWRNFSYEEQLLLRQVRRKARTSTVLGILGVLAGAASDNRAVSDAGVIAGTIAIQRGMELRQESKIHVEALKELAASFDAEIAPALVEVEGETVRLEGTAETQFSRWRELLAEIFATEMGLPLDPNVAPAAASGDGASVVTGTESSESNGETSGGGNGTVTNGTVIKGPGANRTGELHEPGFD